MLNICLPSRPEALYSEESSKVLQPYSEQNPRLVFVDHGVQAGKEDVSTDDSFDQIKL